jgi:putative NADH-flavin reductase
MKICVIGATGGTGVELVRQALATGHEVTAGARSPERIPIDGVRRVRVDLMDPDTLGAAVAGQDVVLDAAGPRGLGPTEIYSRGVPNLVTAMAAHAVRRLLVVSSVGHDPDVVVPFPWNLLLRFAVRPILREPFADAARLDRWISACPLDWTVVRAPMLTNGRATGRVRVGPPNAHLDAATRVSRADLAGAVLGLIGDRTRERAWVEVAW